MPTSERFQQLALRVTDPVQFWYEVIRGPLVEDTARRQWGDRLCSPSGALCASSRRAGDGGRRSVTAVETAMGVTAMGVQAHAAGIGATRQLAPGRPVVG